MAVDLYELVR